MQTDEDEDDDDEDEDDDDDERVREFKLASTKPSLLLIPLRLPLDPPAQ